MNTAFERSIFNRLYSYRPQENRLQEENFFTEAFVGVMEREPELLKEVFRYLTGQEAKHVEISSQVSYPSAMTRDGNIRPDITIRGRDEDGGWHIVFVESKLGSKERADQLNEYGEVLLNERGKSKTIVYITQFSDELKTISPEKGISLKQRRWYEIYHFLINQRELEEKENNLLGELIKFMEELDMTFDIKLNQLLAGVTFSRGQNKFRDLLNQAWAMGGLGKYVEQNYEGKWVPSKLSSKIDWTTPSFGKDRIQLIYGIWFNTKDKGDYDLIFDNPDLPSLYLAIAKWPKKEIKTVYDKYRDYFDELSHKKNWKLLEKPKYVILRKNYNISHFGSSDLSQELLDFFLSSFNEIKDAPFFAE